MIPTIDELLSQIREGKRPNTSSENTQNKKIKNEIELNLPNSSTKNENKKTEFDETKDTVLGSALETHQNSNPLNVPNLNISSHLINEREEILEIHEYSDEISLEISDNQYKYAQKTNLPSTGKLLDKDNRIKTENIGKSIKYENIKILNEDKTELEEISHKNISESKNLTELNMCKLEENINLDSIHINKKFLSINNDFFDSKGTLKEQNHVSKHPPINKFKRRSITDETQLNTQSKTNKLDLNCLSSIKEDIRKTNENTCTIKQLIKCPIYKCKSILLGIVSSITNIGNKTSKITLIDEKDSVECCLSVDILKKHNIKVGDIIELQDFSVWMLENIFINITEKNIKNIY